MAQIGTYLLATLGTNLCHLAGRVTDWLVVLLLCWLRGCTNLWSLADNRLIGGGAASIRCLANWGAGGTGNWIWTGQVWQFFIMACLRGSKDIYCKWSHQLLHNRYTQFFLIWKNGSISGVPECIASELFSSLTFPSGIHELKLKLGLWARRTVWCGIFKCEGDFYY